MASDRPALCMIAALTRQRVIGKDGGIPWHHSEDLKRFRRLTTGHAVIMGRATYASIGKPLKDRRNIVVSRDRSLQLAGCEVAQDLEQALRLARSTDPEPFVIGGGQLYAAALPLATRLYLTWLDEEHAGDVLFPELDATQWIETERQRGEGVTFVTLDRR